MVGWGSHRTQGPKQPLALDCGQRKKRSNRKDENKMKKDFCARSHGTWVNIRQQGKKENARIPRKCAKHEIEAVVNSPPPPERWQIF